MKTFKLALLTALMLLAASAFAEKTELTKHFKHEFKAPPVTKLNLENKFGHINVETWDKKTIRVEVTVKVKNKNERKAQLILNAINIEFSEAENVASALTRFDEAIFKTHRKIFNSLNDGELNINYKVQMPKDVDLKLYNKYGDVFIDRFSAHLNTVVQYGNIKINSLTRGDSKPLNSITLKYGKAYIGYVNWLKMQLRYGSLKADRCQAIILYSKYSKVKIGSISSLVFESKYDTYKIENVSKLIGKSGYTDINITKVFQLFKLKAKYGGVNIKYISQKAKVITFNGSYCGFKAGVDKALSYKLNTNVTYGNIDVEDQNTNLSRIKNNRSVTVYGNVGSSDKNRATINITVKYGNAKLYIP